jgi:hypothetical protein
LNDWTHDDNEAGEGKSMKFSRFDCLFCTKFESRVRRQANARQVAASLDALRMHENMNADGMDEPIVKSGRACMTAPVFAAAQGFALSAKGRDLLQGESLA